MPDFAPYLSDHIAQLGDLRQRGAAEASIRDAFLKFLRGAFPRLERSEPILLEKHIPAAHVAGRSFADALYGDLIFEFKRRLDDGSRAEGQAELARYIANQMHPERYLGILTDGETLEVYALREGHPVKTDQLHLPSVAPAEAELWLDCYLFHEKNRAPTANDVALRFGERGQVFRGSIWILEGLWRQLKSQPGAQTKFGEWQGLLSIVYGSRVGDESLFMRHTYLGLFARVLAFVALQRRAPDDNELPGVLTGGAFGPLGLQNFVDDDFFTWPDVADAAPEVRALVHALATRLTVAYDLSAIHEDLLKELYQELVDPATRHDLGEFYTPDWLAELTLREAGFPPKGSDLASASLLDPSCGSGTFLFTAVRLMREAGLKGTALADYAAHHLAGIDVHPLAVTIAKTNLLLALGDDVRRTRQGFVLPIFMANTLSVEVGRMKGDPQRRAVSVLVDVETLAKRSGKSRARVPNEFEIPLGTAQQPAALHQLIDDLLAFGRPELDAAGARKGLAGQLDNLRIPPAQHDFWYRNLTLMRWLLASPATDSVWRFVLKNAFQPELLAQRRFRYVVGNPPWLAYRYIERADYQQRVRELVFWYELLGKRQANLFTQMELATLFFAVCADRFLNEGGTLAFVMPRSIMTGAKQHAAFGERYLRGARLIIDCERVSPLFNVPACAVIWNKPHGPVEDTADGPVRTIILEGLVPQRNAPLAEAAQRLQQSRGAYRLLQTTEASPYWGQVTQGASIVPRCLWFVRTHPEAWIVDERRPYLQTDPAVDRQAKKPWKGQHLQGNVEAEFLFATLLSDHMVPFGWRHLSLVVLPLAEDQHGSPILIDHDDAVSRGKIGLADWLSMADRKWKLHRKSRENLLAYINWQNKLLRQTIDGVPKMLYNTSGTHLCGCVVEPSRLMGVAHENLSISRFIADTTTYWIGTRSLPAMHYLCAILNAPSVDSAIKPHQPKGAFGAQHGGGQRHIHRRPFEVLPIPLYSAKDERHRKLARLSRRCHDRVARFLAGADAQVLQAPIGRLRTHIRREIVADELKEIDALVVEICRIRR